MNNSTRCGDLSHAVTANRNNMHILKNNRTTLTQKAQYQVITASTTNITDNTIIMLAASSGRRICLRPVFF